MKMAYRHQLFGNRHTDNQEAHTLADMMQNEISTNCTILESKGEVNGTT